VLERRHVVGGAAVTEEFAPGFRNSTAAYTVSLLNPKVIRDLRLAEHGLKIVERPFANFLPLPDGKYFKLGPTTADTQKELARFSKRDAEAPARVLRVIETAADTLRSLVLETPPNLGMSWRSGLSRPRDRRKLALLSRRAQRDLWEIVTKSAGELLDWWFESDPSKRRSASMPRSATSRALTRPARPTYCCNHAFARSTASAAPGDTPWAAWAR